MVPIVEPAQSFVGVSFDQPITIAEIIGISPVNLLEAIRIVNPNVRFYQASTSEMTVEFNLGPIERFYGSDPEDLYRLLKENFNKLSLIDENGVLVLINDYIVLMKLVANGKVGRILCVNSEVKVDVSMLS